MATIDYYSPPKLAAQIGIPTIVIGAIVTGIGLVDSEIFEITGGDVNVGGIGALIFSFGGLMYLAVLADARDWGSATVMGFLSWALYLPFAIGFQLLTLTDIGGVTQTIPTGGELGLGFLSLAPWWYYFWAGFSVFVTAWFITASKFPRWPPRRFVVWPWFTGWFIAFVWPTRLTTNFLDIDIGDWTLTTLWTDVFDATLRDFMDLGVTFELEPIVFGEYWGAFFLFWWLLNAFIIWTAFVYARRIRVGKQNYNDGSV